jgi:hypothetical protein
MSEEIPSEPNAEKRERGQKNRGGRRRPRTPAGIARSCMNALKYGEYVQGILNAKEHRTARVIRQSLYERFPAPRNGLVQRLVEEAVVICLRKQRVEDRMTHDHTMAVQAASLRSWEQLNHRKAEPVRRQLDVIQNGTNPDQFDRMSPEWCAQEMRTLKAKVEARGPVPAEDLPGIKFVYGGDESVTVKTLLAAYESAKRLLAEPPGSVQDPSMPNLAKIKEIILLVLEVEISSQEELAKQEAAFEIQSLSADIAALPPDSSWDRYFRITLALDRQLDRVLERASRFYKPSTPASS